jgi:hypothetical protein
VHGDPLGARGDDDEVAVPRGELLERQQELFPLGSSLRASQALVGGSSREVQSLQLALGGSARRASATASIVRRSSISRVSSASRAARYSVDSPGNVMAMHG